MEFYLEALQWSVTFVPSRDRFNSEFERLPQLCGGLYAQSAGASSRKSLAINMEVLAKQQGESVEGTPPTSLQVKPKDVTACGDAVNCCFLLFSLVLMLLQSPSGRTFTEEQAIDLLVSLVATDANSKAKWRGFYHSLTSSQLKKEWDQHWWVCQKENLIPSLRSWTPFGLIKPLKWVPGSFTLSWTDQHFCVKRRCAPSLTPIAVANCLSSGLASSHHLFYASVECLALLFHCTYAESDCCKGDRGNNGCGELGQAVSDHRPLFSAALFWSFLVDVLFCHGKKWTPKTLWFWAVHYVPT